MTWRDILLEMLCRLYKDMGGDCADLGIEPLKVIQESYDADGLPKFPTQADRDAFVSLIAELQAHLADPGNDLSAADNAKANALVAQIENDLSNGP